MKALDFAIVNEVTGMKLGSLMDSVESNRQRGNEIKANMINKRLLELKKVSQLMTIVVR